MLFNITGYMDWDDMWSGNTSTYSSFNDMENRLGEAGNSQNVAPFISYSLVLEDFDSG